MSPLAGHFHDVVQACHLPAIFTYLHDREVVAVAKASKALQREALASCGCTAGQVYVTAAGLSGLWRIFELWEVAVLLNEFPQSYRLPFKFLSEYILHDKRSARSLFTAAHEALHRATVFHNSTRAIEGIETRLRLYFATFSFDAPQVHWFLDTPQIHPEYGRDDELNRIRRAAISFSLVDIHDLRTTIVLSIEPSVEEDMTFEYDLQITVLSDEEGGTRALFCVSLLPYHCTIVSVYTGSRTWAGGRKTVRRNSSIDKAMFSGKPLPFILAIRSSTAAGEAIDDGSMVLRFGC